MLNGYAESGPSAELLNYAAMKFDAMSGALGLRGSIDIPMSFGVFSPTARFEYKQTSQSAYDQAMYYSDIGGGTSSTFSEPAGVYGMTTGALGFRARGERTRGRGRIRRVAGNRRAAGAGDPRRLAYAVLKSAKPLDTPA
jgi:hypothetical protein